MTRRARPFPFDALPRVSSEDATIGNAVRRLARARFDVHGLERALSEISKATASVRLRGVSLTRGARAADAACAVAIGDADARGLAETALVVAEGPLAARVVAAALSREAPRVADPIREPTPELSGATAAVLVACARAASGPAPLRALAAGPATRLARDHAAAAGDVVEARLTVSIGEATFDAAVLVPRALVAFAPSPPWDTSRLAALGVTPLSLMAVASSASASRAEIASLRPGDVWAPGDLALAANAAGRLEGPLVLVAPRSEAGLSARLVDGARVVVGGSERAPWSEPHGRPEDDMDGETADAPLLAVEDAPLVVRVEVGTARLSAREWSAVSEGDVLTLDRRLADPVSLRVGGVEIARGELVDVDGELGVRVTSLLRGGD